MGREEGNEVCHDGKGREGEKGVGERGVSKG